MAASYDVVAIRSDLPALRDVTYLNFGTEGVMAESVLAKYFEVLGRFERYGHYERMRIVEHMQACRERVGKIVKAYASEVSITRNGTDGVSIVLGSFPFQEGDELLIGGEEHPAIVYPAFALQKTRGVIVRRFPFHHDPSQTLRAFAAALTPKTRFVAFSHVSCETGIRNPAKAIISIAHARGVPVLLDGAQTIGCLDIDFPDLGADFLTGSAHKWLCGPKGTGILVIRTDKLDSLTPAYVGGGSFAEGFPWDKLGEPASVTFEWAPGAARFEYGMRNPATYAGLNFAIDHLDSLGWKSIHSHQRSMTEDLKRRLGAVPGIRIQTPMSWSDSSPIVNVAVEGVRGRDVSQKLWNDYAIVQRAVRDPDGVRISTGYCTTTADHDRLIQALTVIARTN